MLPKKSFLNVTRYEGGWKSDCCSKGQGCPEVHHSFISALECMYRFGGKICILDIEHLFPSEEGVTFEDCIQESEEDTLRVLRWAWMRDHRHHVKMLKGNGKRGEADQIERQFERIREKIVAMKKIQEMFDKAKYPLVWGCLEEAAAHYQLLLEEEWITEFATLQQS